MFKLIVKTQEPKAMAKSFDVNLMTIMTKLCTLISNNGLLAQRLSEYFKLVEITIISVFEFVKDEHTCSTFTFMKDKL